MAATRYRIRRLLLRRLHRCIRCGARRAQGSRHCLECLRIKAAKRRPPA